MSPLEWFLPSTFGPVLWVVASTIGMYTTIFGYARWSGVRSFAEMSTYDIAVTIAIGSLLATTVATKDPPLLQGMVALTTLFAIQLCISRLRSHYSGVRRATDNTPILLMGPGGTMKRRSMAVARVTEQDLRTHLRGANVLDPSRIDAVVIEGTGEIHVLSGHGGQLPQGSWVLEDVRDYDTPAG